MLEILSHVLVALGAGSLLIASIGVNRLPDFFTRSHAASKPDTLGLILTMLGLSVHEGLDLNTIKLLLIVVLVAIANPVATHALGRAAISNRQIPWLRGQSRPDRGTS